MERETKIKLIEEGTFKEYQKTKYLLRKNKTDFQKSEEILKMTFGPDFENLKKLSHNKQQQKKKVENFIEWHLTHKKDNEKIFFATFTYDDKKRKSKNKTIKKETLKKYIERALIKAEDYNLNVDFGEYKERLHFHGIIILDEKYIDHIEPYKTKNHGRWHTIQRAITKDIFEEYIQKVGMVVLEEIDTKNEKSIAKISNYMSKLVNHSAKTQQSYITTKKGSKYQNHKKQVETYFKVRNRNNTKWNEKLERILQA